MADLSLLQEDLQEEIDGFGVDDYSSESDVIIIPSALDFVSQDEMLTPLGRLDKYAASENIFNSTSGGVVCCTQSIQFGSSRRDNGQCQEGNRITDGTNYQ